MSVSSVPINYTTSEKAIKYIGKAIENIEDEDLVLKLTTLLSDYIVMYDRRAKYIEYKKKYERTPARIEKRKIYCKQKYQEKKMLDNDKEYIVVEHDKEYNSN